MSVAEEQELDQLGNLALRRLELELSRTDSTVKETKNTPTITQKLLLDATRENKMLRDELEEKLAAYNAVCKTLHAVRAELANRINENEAAQWHTRLVQEEKENIALRAEIGALCQENAKMLGALQNIARGDWGMGNTYPIDVSRAAIPRRIGPPCALNECDSCEDCCSAKYNGTEVNDKWLA